MNDKSTIVLGARGEEIETLGGTKEWRGGGGERGDDMLSR